MEYEFQPMWDPPHTQSLPVYFTSLRASGRQPGPPLRAQTIRGPSGLQIFNKRGAPEVRKLILYSLCRRSV